MKKILIFSAIILVVLAAVLKNTRFSSDTVDVQVQVLEEHAIQP